MCNATFHTARSTHQPNRRRVSPHLAPSSSVSFPVCIATIRRATLRQARAHCTLSMPHVTAPQPCKERVHEVAAALFLALASVLARAGHRGSPLVRGIARKSCVADAFAPCCVVVSL